MKKLNVIPLIFGSLLILEGCEEKKTSASSDTINENTPDSKPPIDNKKQSDNDNSKNNNSKPPIDKESQFNNDNPKNNNNAIEPKNYGLNLSEIPDNLKTSIPKNINWKTINNFSNNHRLGDLVYFQGAANVPAKEFNLNWAGESGVPFDSFDLYTNESRSMYAIHGIKTDEKSGLGRKCDIKVGPNQCDFSRIVNSTSSDSLYVTIAPTERTKNCEPESINTDQKLNTDQKIEAKQALMKPFFDVLEKENIGIVVDLRNYCCDRNKEKQYVYYSNISNINTIDATSSYKNTQDPPTYLKQKDFHCPKNAVSDDNKFEIPSGFGEDPDAADLCHFSPIYFTETYTNDGKKQYDFIHFRVKNLADNKAMNPNNFCTLMKQLDEVQQKAKTAKINSEKIAFHCNGGLGRAPTVMVVRAIWNVFRDTKIAGRTVICNLDKQDEWEIDNQINLAAVLRNVMVLGYYARSTFVQTKDQLDALPAFVKYLVDNQNTIIK